MGKVKLTKGWTYKGKVYGPGDSVEVPKEAQDAIKERDPDSIKKAVAPRKADDQDDNRGGGGQEGGADLNPGGEGGEGGGQEGSGG